MSDTELTVAEPTSLTERNIDTVTGEIVEICRQAQVMALSYAVEVGRRLTEAKELLPHGEWGNWLKDRVNFSQSTANNLMRLFREYGSQQVVVCGVLSNSQSIANLPYTKALRLLAIPAEEREEFAQEHNAAEISTKELEQAIRERDQALRERDEALAAQKQLDQLEADAKKAGVKLALTEHTLEQKNAELQEAEQHRKELTEQLEQLKSAAEPSPEQLAELESKAKKKLEKDFRKSQKEADAKIKALETALSEQEKTLKAVKQELAEAGQNRQTDEEAVKRYEDEILRLRKQAAMADPDTTEFRTVFDSVQVQIAKLTEIAGRVESTDSEKANRFRQALQALANKLIGGTTGI